MDYNNPKGSGRKAFLQGRARDLNPCDYRTNANARLEWDRGWVAQSEDTAFADYYAAYTGAKGLIHAFYSETKSGILDYLNNDGYWEKTDIARDDLPGDTIELSRPQADIVKLFEGAPDWATGRLCEQRVAIELAYDKWVGK